MGLLPGGGELNYPEESFPAGSDVVRSFTAGSDVVGSFTAGSDVVREESFPAGSDVVREESFPAFDDGPGGSSTTEEGDVVSSTEQSGPGIFV